MYVRPSSAPAGNAPSFSLPFWRPFSFTSARKLVRSRTPCSIPRRRTLTCKKVDGGRLEPEEIREEKKGAKKNSFATPSLVTMKLCLRRPTSTLILTLRWRRLSNLTEEVQHNNSWKGRKELGEAKHRNALISFHMHRLPHLL